MSSFLTTICKQQFTTGDRIRGEEYYVRKCVDFVEVGCKGAIAMVDGSGDEDYQVAVNLKDLEDSEIGVWCDCPRFEQGDYCKHLWATLRRLDRCYDFKSLLEVPVRACRLFAEDCRDLDCGEAMQERGPGGRSSSPANPSTTSKHHAAQEVAGTAAESSLSDRNAVERERQPWEKRLAKLLPSNRDYSATGSSKPNALKESSLAYPQESKYLFELKVVSDPAGNRFVIRIHRSVREKREPADDGGWSKPELLKFKNLFAAVTSHPEILHTLEQLEWEQNDFELNYGYRSEVFVSHRTEFGLNPNFLMESLSDMALNHQLVWNEEGDSNLEDCPALDFDPGGPWRLKIRVELSEDEENIVFNPILVREDVAGTGDSPEETRPIETILATCHSGAVVYDVNTLDVNTRGEIGIVDEDSLEWVQACSQAGTQTIPREQLGRALQAMHEMADTPEFDFAEELRIAIESPQPTPKLVLKKPERSSNKMLNAEIWVKYGNVEIEIGDPSSAIWCEETNSLLLRDFDVEEEFPEDLETLPFKQTVDYNRLEIRIHNKWLTEIVTTLNAEGWEVVAEGGIFRTASQFQVSVSSGTDWFELDAHASFDGQQVGLPALLSALRKGEKHVVLGDGTQGLLPAKWLERFKHAGEFGVVEEGALRFQSNQALLLDMLLAEQEDVQRDKYFDKWCKNLHSFTGVKPAKEPRGFRGELREYQRDGLGWFNFLQEFGFGGCLADDMGLGKTIQVLALLQARKIRKLKKGEARKPSIAIVPKSLVFNWQEEAAKFTPDLKVIDYTGTGRNNLNSQIAEVDLIITTYATFRRDISTWQDREFDYAILDEAQAIKNPTAQASKAVRLLKAAHRLAMTGTPIENHLGDLWSIFEFLNPGMLGRSKASINFRPGEGDSDRVRALGNALRPFILRRTKEQVLKELPDKTEQTLYCDMSPKQKKLYTELRDHYRENLTKQVAKAGLKQSKIHVLEALLRLRQAACDPRLLDEKSKVPGAKIELLLEQLDEVICDGHKVLVFSQFTSLLKIFSSAVEKRGWQYAYLDGSSNRRDKIVSRFQNDDDCPLFLISLKAGGHGLNLTAADYVYLLDPWWNPAIEAQAIDRAHRMGQQKPVMAYRMITRGTVEDKIIELQKNKRDLADAIISADESLIRSLSMDDLQVLLGA